jgi:hypothetical protein
MNRVTAGRIGGLTTASRRTGREMSAPARQAWMDRWERQADPEGTLAPQERARRASALRRAHMQRLAALSADARRRKS